MAISPLLDRYHHVLLDLDGCVWVGDRPTPGAAEAIEALRRTGKSVAFLTNDPRGSPEEYVRKLWAVGIKASLEEVVTVGAAIQHLLAQRAPRTETYVIGARVIFRHVAEAGMRVEGSAAAALAGARQLAGSLKGTVVLIVTGRNIDDALWRRAVERPASLACPSPPAGTGCPRRSPRPRRCEGRREIPGRGHSHGARRRRTRNLYRTDCGGRARCRRSPAIAALTASPGAGSTAPDAGMCSTSSRPSPLRVSMMAVRRPSARRSSPVSPAWPPPCG